MSICAKFLIVSSWIITRKSRFCNVVRSQITVYIHTGMMSYTRMRDFWLTSRPLPPVIPEKTLQHSPLHVHELMIWICNLTAPCKTPTWVFQPLVSCKTVSSVLILFPVIFKRICKRYIANDACPYFLTYFFKAVCLVFADSVSKLR